MNVELSLLLPKLIELYAAAVTFAANAHDDDGIDADDIAKLLVESSKGWNPRVGGVAVLDDKETRYAAARFLAGIAIQASKRRIRRRKAKMDREREKDSGEAE